MNRWLQLGLFLVGVALFGHLIADIGVTRLRDDALTTGWMMVPVISLFGVIYLIDAFALKLILAEEPNQPSLGATFATVVAGQALNFITPMVNVGGEPYKVAALAPLVGGRRAAGSVLLHTMIRSLALLLVWVTAIGLGLAYLPHDRLTIGLLLIGLGLVGGLITLLLALHRRGGVAKLAGWLARGPFPARLASALERHRPALEAMDAQVTDFYHRHPRRFLAALGLSYLSRAVFMIEFCLIGLSIGVSVGYVRAFTIGGLEGLISNGLFFVPFELGTRESATELLFRNLGFPGGIGLYAALVGRVRDLVWIAIGLGMIWVRGRRPAPSAIPADGTS